MAENLFQGLPPPAMSPSRSSVQHRQEQSLKLNVNKGNNNNARDSPPIPNPALKSALKRPKPPALNQEATAAPEKRIRFKTTTDASETQVIEAMQKIASHIKNPAKFSKASKLAIQLIQAGSVNAGTSIHFFAILEAAMSSPTSCNDASVRADYHALFLAAQETVECLNKKQRTYLATWTIRAVLGNDLLTDDSFVFSKAAGKLKEAISSLPVATEDDDIDEAAALKDETETENAEEQEKKETSREADVKEELDPFGLDSLIPNTLQKDEMIKGKKDASAKIKKQEEEEENKRFLKSKREALILCLETAVRRYKLPWCQTVIDILVKHAFDNISRFTSRQREAIERLWASIREQNIRRKQGKSVTGKLDMNAFEFLQQKYANEKISIRHSVGGSGDHRAEQWLG